MNTRAKAVTVEELNLTEMENVNGAGLLDYLRRAAFKTGAWLAKNEKNIKAHTVGVITSFFSNANVGTYLKDEYKKNH